MSTNAVDLRKAVGYAVAGAGAAPVLRKAAGYAVLDSRAAAWLRKGAGYAVLHDATTYGTAANVLGDLVSAGTGTAGTVEVTGAGAAVLGDLASAAAGLADTYRLRKAVGYALLDGAGVRKAAGYAVLDARTALLLRKAAGYALVGEGPRVGAGAAVLGDLLSAGLGAVTWPAPRVRVERLRGSWRPAVALVGTWPGGGAVRLAGGERRRVALFATWVARV